MRYLVFGILIGIVNIASYRLLMPEAGILAANTAAFFIAVLFAYFVNSKFIL